MASYKQTEYEVLRRRCVALYQQGWKQVAIAQALGLTQGWVSRTLTKFHQQGQDALAWRKPPGATARLTNEQLVQLVQELNKGADHHGFPAHIWTRPRVNEPGRRGGCQTTLWRQLRSIQDKQAAKKMELTRQKPQTKARQQDPQRVQQWREERLPELKKSPN